MGLRGIIKDILIVYLSFMIIYVAAKGKDINPPMIIVSIILLILVAWFMLERIGILEQM
ncbi:MAG: hypothetical protein ABIH63_01800 [archaeon]